ncbi:MAG: hypothetical protein ACR2PX_01415 [Endozoicomonas sp.]|uniref:hypothetical protein n=1 Tax=Endozoicomonas sp. TaxID=1892382 RepID=UPI003D9B7A6D
MKKELSCFAIPDSAHSPHQNHPLQAWMENEDAVMTGLNEEQKSALARLVPLLLCGEQSAMLVFHNECQRLNTDSFGSLQALQQIEADEFIHEQALQRLQQWLPTPDDIRLIKRRSQLFYARLHKHSRTIKEHFILISQLDACVCVIMSAMTQAMRHQPSMQSLFQRILEDEARHVYVSRTHARSLNSNNTQDGQHSDLHHQLIALLNTEENAFKALDVNTGLLFQRIEELALKRNRV